MIQYGLTCTEIKTCVNRCLCPSNAHAIKHLRLTLTSLKSGVAIPVTDQEHRDLSKRD